MSSTIKAVDYLESTMEQLETWQVTLIIIGVLGIIWSNIALLKYATKFEVKQKLEKQTHKETTKKSAD